MNCAIHFSRIFHGRAYIYNNYWRNEFVFNHAVERFTCAHGIDRVDCLASLIQFSHKKTKLFIFALFASLLLASIGFAALQISVNSTGQPGANITITGRFVNDSNTSQGLENISINGTFFSGNGTNFIGGIGPGT